MRAKLLTSLAVFAIAAAAIALLHSSRADDASAFPAPAAGQAIYSIDPAHTSLVFSIFRSGLNNVYGMFNDKSGRILVDEAHPENSYVEFTVNMASVDTGQPKRDDHLRTADFFNVDKFATATFRSASVSPTGPGALHIDGTLTFLGIERPLGVEMTITGPVDGKRGRAFGFNTSFSFLRSDFGMAKSDGQADEVFLTLSGAANQEQPADAVKPAA